MRQIVDVVISRTRFGAMMQITAGTTAWSKCYASLHEASLEASDLELVQEKYARMIPLIGQNFASDGLDVDTRQLQIRGFDRCTLRGGMPVTHQEARPPVPAQRRPAATQAANM